MSNTKKLWAFAILLALTLGATYLVGRTVRFGAPASVMSERAAADAAKSAVAADIAVSSARNAADVAVTPVVAK